MLANPEMGRERGNGNKELGPLMLARNAAQMRPAGSARKRHQFLLPQLDFCSLANVIVFHPSSGAKSNQVFYEIGLIQGGGFLFDWRKPVFFSDC